MKFHSTRGQEFKSIDEVLFASTALDGGLFVPNSLPLFNPKDLVGLNLPDLATKVLTPFFNDSPLKKDLAEACRFAFNFPLPVKPITQELFVLEEFWGPSAAFKDFGARFLAFFCKKYAKGEILVATSGDTGTAVAAAFYDSQIPTTVLFPNKKVSPLQEYLLSCWGKNVNSYAVNGTFDDCQNMVKKKFIADKSGKYISANSINLGRLLPQMIMYAYSSLQIANANYFIPTGNLGNGYSCLLAKLMGFPIGQITFCTNANQTLFEFFSTGELKIRTSRQTLANAMDVGNPSNLERLTHLVPNFKNLKELCKVTSVSDPEIEETIKLVYSRFKYISCPHTATAFKSYFDKPSKPALVVATAHPAKFSETVSSLISKPVPLPENLKTLMSRPSKFKIIEPDEF